MCLTVASITIGLVSQAALTFVGPFPASTSMVAHSARASEVQSSVTANRPRARPRKALTEWLFIHVCEDRLPFDCPTRRPAPEVTRQVMRSVAEATSASFALLSTMAQRTSAVSRPSITKALPVPVVADGTSSVSCSL